ncbi:MAG: hypothetical protein E5X35_11505 [Mesorhizobium sp.]|uniref:hypothetical protein n=1 Tax=unclassified Mesorhizobium TaxID=325217 RepID=UPI000FCAB89B|nr:MULTISPECIES: hypothetical protein [unclassified Mesorhizobium]RUV65224.1 hypothetical protein EOA85_00235 [Mesorhizobium sp. M5C.F.Ca.IN.020.29.1.1]TIM87664.1 MAG: hypothetical protein E5Y50_11565 [Mesorhizobium sp.]TIR33285.1 MAG: hypothetical protein E5X35_11505 [Mesorhizobium sp.]
MSRKVQIVNMEAAESERDVVVTTLDGTVHTIRPGRSLDIETGDVIGVSYRNLVERIEVPDFSPAIDAIDETLAMLDDAKKDVADAIIGDATTANAPATVATVESAPRKQPVAKAKARAKK